MMSVIPVKQVPASQAIEILIKLVCVVECGTFELRLKQRRPQHLHDIERRVDLY